MQLAKRSLQRLSIHIQRVFKFGMAVMLSGAASISQANLITNGSFEDNDVPYGQWRWYTSDQVNGWNGSNIEIWDHLQGEQAYHGRQFAELNAHPRPATAFTIFQDIDTVAGQRYDFSFAYQARVDSANESFLASILDVNGLIDEWVLSNHTTAGWSVLNASFVANDAQSRIQFTSLTPVTHTYGNFIDDVRVTASVSEPASIALLGLGIVGLGWMRRRRQAN